MLTHWSYIFLTLTHLCYLHNGISYPNIEPAPRVTKNLILYGNVCLRVITRDTQSSPIWVRRVCFVHPKSLLCSLHVMLSQTTVTTLQKFWVRFHDKRRNPWSRVNRHYSTVQASFVLCSVTPVLCLSVSIPTEPSSHYRNKRSLQMWPPEYKSYNFTIMKAHNSYILITDNAIESPSYPLPQSSWSREWEVQDHHSLHHQQQWDWKPSDIINEINRKSSVWQCPTAVWHRCIGSHQVVTPLIYELWHPYTACIAWVSSGGT